MSVVEQKLPAALSANLWLTMGGGLALLGFPWIFRLWALSLFGRTSANYVLAAVLIAVTANLVEMGCFTARCTTPNTGRC